jgi:hypothetical protein
VLTLVEHMFVYLYARGVDYISGYKISYFDVIWLHEFVRQKSPYPSSRAAGELAAWAL